jgi:hypothetical protein
MYGSRTLEFTAPIDTHSNSYVQRALPLHRCALSVLWIMLCDAVAFLLQHVYLQILPSEVCKRRDLHLSIEISGSVEMPGRSHVSLLLPYALHDRG